MKRFRLKRTVVIILAFLICLFTISATVEEKPVEIAPENFGGVDPCLRDTSGSENSCSRRFGVIREPGGQPERPCVLLPDAAAALKDAVKFMKEENPDIEIMVVSSYRPPGHQQCLWVKKTSKGYKCNPYVCGPRDPRTRKRLPCKIYDLDDPRYAHIYDHCPHVNFRTVDVCAYDKTRVKMNRRNQMDLSIIEDCRKYKRKGNDLSEGWSYHPCCCRFVSWTGDFRNGSQRANKIFGKEAVEAQRIMIRSMRKAGFKDDAPGEWWHFRYYGNRK